MEGNTVQATFSLPQTSAAEAGLFVVRRLQEHGFGAVFPGGVVRDLLRGCEPHDFDVATSACPAEVVALFPRTIAVGEKFGVTFVFIEVDGCEFSVEVATFREEGGYNDGRRPGEIMFLTDLPLDQAVRRDCARRDLTINSMAWDPRSGELFDFFGGQRDLEQGIIRAVGSPENRIAEDQLRMMRAIRFAGKFGFEIEGELFEAIARNANRLCESVSAERIKDELDKLFQTPFRVAAFRSLLRSGLLRVILPELAQSDASKAIARLGDLPNDASLNACWATLLLSIGEVQQPLRRLKFTNEQRELVAGIIRDTQLALRGSLSTRNRRLILGNTAVSDVVTVLKAVQGGCSIACELSQELKRRRNGEVTMRPNAEPLVTGDTLINLGHKPGKEFSEILSTALDAQFEGMFFGVEDGAKWIAMRLAQN